MKRLVLIFVFFISFVSFSQTNDIKVFTPDFLVPDGNGYLDVWKPEFSEQPKDYKLYIYCPYTNEVLFQTDNLNEGWDGNNMFPQLYKYIIIYVTNDNKIVEIKNSFIKQV
jgi:gliding motility-associated-like protein